MRAISVWLVFVVGLGIPALAVQGSCYSPEIAECQYACNNSSCPTDMLCNTQNMCVIELGTLCGPLQGDGGPPPDSDNDAAGPDDSSPPFDDAGGPTSDASSDDAGTP